MVRHQIHILLCDAYLLFNGLGGLVGEVWGLRLDFFGEIIYLYQWR